MGAKRYSVCIKFGASWGVSGRLHTTAASPPEKVSGIQWTGGWVLPSVALEGVQKKEISLPTGNCTLCSTKIKRPEIL
jgi:hypothetical protein